MIRFPASHRYLTFGDKTALLCVFRALGTQRVQRAMTRTCKVTYQNKGWRNCFLTQAMGGYAALKRLKERHRRSHGLPYADSTGSVIASVLGVSRLDIDIFISMFDALENDSVGNVIRPKADGHFVVLSYAQKWLRDRLRRAGREITYIAPYNIRQRRLAA